MKRAVSPTPPSDLATQGILRAIPELSARQNQCLSALWRLVLPYWEANAVLGHGPGHALRVHDHALALARLQGANLFVVAAAASLVDCGLNAIELHTGHTQRSIEIGVAAMVSLGIPEPIQQAICEAIAYHSASSIPPSCASIETIIVRDSDRLDRLGFTGVSMTLEYGVFVRRELMHPEDPFCDTPRPLELDSYSFDYLRFLFDIAAGLMLAPAIPIARLKVAELRSYLISARSLAMKGALRGHDNAISLLQRIS